MSLSLRGVSQNCWQRTFNGTLSDIASAASWIELIAEELSLPESQSFAMQVCLEELMSNVVQHGMESSSQVNPGSLSITITVETFQDRTTMTIEDNGRPFDVVHAPSKAIDQPLEQLRPGGLGIHLIKNFASKLSYNRTESGNRVTVEFTG